MNSNYSFCELTRLRRAICQRQIDKEVAEIPKPVLERPAFLPDGKWNGQCYGIKDLYRVYIDNKEYKLNKEERDQAVAWFKEKSAYENAVQKTIAEVKARYDIDQPQPEPAKFSIKEKLLFVGIVALLILCSALGKYANG